MNNVDIGKYSKRLVQYIWDPEPANSDATALSIWCLGQRYESHRRIDPDDRSYQPHKDAMPPSPPTTGNASSSLVTQVSELSSSCQDQHHDTAPQNSAHREASNNATAASQWPSSFLDDFESRIWLTYRSGFAPIPKSHDPKASASMSLSVRLKSSFGSHDGFTSDTGWGCMIRSGQALLANALSVLKLGRDWRRGESVVEEKNLLQLFADDPSAPFSIHKFVHHGASACGTYPGQWFGPSATAKCIEALTNSHRECGMRVYVTGDGPDIYEDTLLRIAGNEKGTFQPTLLLIGTRLGIDRVTPAYREALKAALQLPQSVGIAGGRPSASHYFVGLQGCQFFYLDPHFPRPALLPREKAEDLTAEDVDSCHTRRLRRMHINELDPSMLIAFLFRSEDDWRIWRQTIEESRCKPIVHVASMQPEPHGYGVERDGAVDEVQTFDDDDVDDDDGGGGGGDGQLSESSDERN